MNSLCATEELLSRPPPLRRFPFVRGNSLVGDWSTLLRVASLHNGELCSVNVQPSFSPWSRLDEATSDPS